MYIELDPVDVPAARNVGSLFGHSSVRRSTNRQCSTEVSDPSRRLVLTRVSTRNETGWAQVVEVAATEPLDILEHFHARLDAHFTALSTARSALAPAPPVFVLEHDLSPAELELLKSAVRAVVSWGLQTRHRRPWLPFVVYGAEHGYDYVGGKYWPPFEASTPGWTYDHRTWLRNQFRKFADAYGGARPTGAFAGTFRIIAWPITHAVLPTYLQRHLAQLLFEFRRGLSTDLLSDPAELGRRLEPRARGYTERFRIFCRNTELLGHVSAALLAGDDDESPYLLGSTLERIVEGLSSESQARHWLSSAQHTASKVRSSGFKQTAGTSSSKTGSRLPRATDPRFFLRYLDGAWNAYAEMPDLAALSERLDHVYDELADRRAEVNGVRKKLATGRLVHAGQEVRFETWPDPAKPFIQLEDGSGSVNHVIADQCVMTPGPWWLFRRQGGGTAIEIKGRMLRPGRRYVLLGASNLQVPPVAWARACPLNVEGVAAHELDVPAHLTDEIIALLDEHGLATLSSVFIRPVGIVASAWDGEGTAEWLAGEPAIIGIRSELLPARCLVTGGDQSFLVDWPDDEAELLLSLEGLGVGTHEISAALLGANGQELASGALVVTVRDPQVRTEGATPGEGLRMLASPARPTLDELWDEEASVDIEGPVGTRADLHVRLKREDGSELASMHRAVDLPVDERSWARVIEAIRSERHFKDSYDRAESCVLTIARDGVGFATLTCERSFVPLRWRFRRERNGVVTASLTDRTGGTAARADLYSVESPLLAVAQDSHTPIALPPRGGLLLATSGEVSSAVIAPTNPNAYRLSHGERTTIQYGASSPGEIVRLAAGYQMWAQGSPPDAFATRDQQVVLDAIARAIPSMACGNHWASLERKLEWTDDPADLLDRMQDLIGLSAAHKALGEAIGFNLHHWLSPEDLLLGFDGVIAAALRENGVQAQPTAARFLLTLAGRPGHILDWPEADRDHLLQRVVSSPVLLRAARFAVLGTRILDQESASRGF
jgi:hypothetical protein